MQQADQHELDAKRFEVEWQRQVAPLTARPPITISGVQIPPGVHLTASAPISCPVLGDSKCLYYCALASHDAEAWMRTHGPQGQPSNPEQARKELQQAQAILELVAARAEAEGCPEAAHRLRGTGPGAYPGLDDIQYLATVMGGAVVSQAGDVQVVHGEGLLLMHVYFTTCVDAVGNHAPHWELLQSWQPRQCDPAAESALSDLPSRSAMAPDAIDPELQARLEIPGASTSSDDFTKLFGDLQEAMELDEALVKESPRSHQIIIGTPSHIQDNPAKKHCGNTNGVLIASQLT